jgi:drug/metabolite transporter (DMT)-like permease
MTKPAAFMLFINATILTSFSQIMLKMGMARFSLDILAMISNLFLITGIALYGVAAIMVVYGLKQGELSVLYPVIATSYLWVALFAYLFFHEQFTALRITGISLVVAGVAFTGIGGRK